MSEAAQSPLEPSAANQYSLDGVTESRVLWERIYNSPSDYTVTWRTLQGQTNPAMAEVGWVGSVSRTDDEGGEALYIVATKGTHETPRLFDDDGTPVVVVYTPDEWVAFVLGTRDGDFDFYGRQDGPQTT